MKSKPYTDEEIVEKLADGRIAATSPKSAINLALQHSRAKVEYKRNGEWFLSTGVIIPHPYRVTIPIPPKRRALRREELPSVPYAVWFEGEKAPRISVFIRQEMTGGGEPTVEENRYSVDAKTWHPLWIDEPQEPLVISTEGGE